MRIRSFCGVKTGLRVSRRMTSPMSWGGWVGDGLALAEASVTLTPAEIETGCSEVLCLFPCLIIQIPRTRMRRRTRTIAIGCFTSARTPAEVSASSGSRNWRYWEAHKAYCPPNTEPAKQFGKIQIHRSARQQPASRGRHRPAHSVSNPDRFRKSFRRQLCRRIPAHSHPRHDRCRAHSSARFRPKSEEVKVITSFCRPSISSAC